MLYSPDVRRRHPFVRSLGKGKDICALDDIPDSLYSLQPSSSTPPCSFLDDSPRHRVLVPAVSSLVNVLDVRVVADVSTL